MSDNNFSHFIYRMRFVVKNKRQWVAKYCNSFLKTNLVFLDI